jgi:hypothetical protein
LFRGLLCLIAFTVVFSGFVVANGASDRRAGEAVMMGVVTSYSADKGSLDTPPRICRGGHGGQGKGQNGAN